MGTVVGILGFAHGHVGSYCAEWKKSPAPGVDLVAGWDHDAARLAKAAESYGVKAHASMAELLVRRDVKAVVIGVETSMHAEVVEAAAAAGKAIVLQKPIALKIGRAHV
mgnify:CR=1 FL=1